MKEPLVIEPSRMTFSILNTGADIVRVTVCGRFDVRMVGLFRRELANLVRIRPRCVEVDMSRLRYIDAAGVDLLLSFFKDLSGQGGLSVVRGLRSQPLDSFKAILLEAVLATSGPAN